MKKPAELRAYLTRANAYLTRDPDKLHIFVDKGRLTASGVPSYSHEYRYELNLVIEDYRGPADAFMLPLLAWLRRHQPELFENPDRRADAIVYDVEILSHDTVDLSVTVPLTERVLARIDPTSGQLVLAYVGEPEDPNLFTDPDKQDRDIILDDVKIATLPYPGWMPGP